MKSVRLAVCGAGNRGSSITLNVICALEDVQIVSVCDLREATAQTLAEQVAEKKGLRPSVYSDYTRMFDEERLRQRRRRRTRRY